MDKIELVEKMLARKLFEYEKIILKKNKPFYVNMARGNGRKFYARKYNQIIQNKQNIDSSNNIN